MAAIVIVTIVHQQLRRVEQQNIELTEANNDLNINNAILNEKLDTLTKVKAKLEEETETRFKNLANEILRLNSEQFSSQQTSRLNDLLIPLRENIETLRKNIHDNHIAEANDRAALKERIASLHTIEESIRSEAQNLTTALKRDTRVQGNWGEMILESILENSGLKKGENFTIQEVFSCDGKAVRTDAVVYFPDNRAIVIDSKVSLTDYLSAVDSKTPEERTSLLKRHVASVRRHISELTAVGYETQISKAKGATTVDFVFMFIPNEASYIAAMQTDGTLWQEAYDKKVIIISPTQLVTTLRLISQIWRQDAISKNAIKIAEETGLMYDKFALFAESLTSINTALQKAQSAYDEAIKRLCTGRGNLLGKIESIRKMGINPKRNIPKELTQLPEEDNGSD